VRIEASIWIYWLFCSVATVLVVANRKVWYSLLSPALDSSDAKRGYFITLILSWVATLLTSAIYVVFTVKEVAGSYQLSDLFLFSVLNGVLEQFMFVFWFLLGCFLGLKQSPNQPIRVFIYGYISYVLYSGLIHPLFWFQVLPEHQLFAPMAAILPFMSLFWMWLLWRYRAIVSIVLMHIVIDFLMIGHLNFAWFE
jgi:hypothetical protein